MIGTILFVTFLVLLVIGAPIALCLGAQHYWLFLQPEM